MSGEIPTRIGCPQCSCGPLIYIGWQQRYWCLTCMAEWTPEELDHALKLRGEPRREWRPTVTPDEPAEGGVQP